LTEPLHTRFALSQRAQHALLIGGFTTLAVTGLTQTFADGWFGERAIGMLGGIEVVRIAHRAAAVVLMVTAIWHLLAAAHHIFVRRRPLAILPRAADLRDFWQTLRYNFGRAAERPRMGRFTFEEKVEYWALLWGTALMVVTGFMLWNPIATTRFLPGQWIPAAQVVHRGEAILAVLAVLVWHGYGVHLRHFNRSMFTGTMTEEEMLREHPLELESLRTAPPATEEDGRARKRRERVFWPVCLVVSLVLTAGLVWFVTFEETALPLKTPAAVSGTAP
jgi:cytochrome b subunit of formate dehydrogenase